MDFSPITNDIYIGTTPKATDYDLLRELGVKLVINMRFGRSPYPDSHPEPLDFLWLRTLDSPFMLIPIQMLIKGTLAALETIQKGGKVYSHCAKGRHRSVAMGAAILIAQGYSPESAMNLIKLQRPISDPGLFYVRSRIFQFAHHWHANKHTFHGLSSQDHQR
jgi:protein tyrosine phosphatase (PTP) superfamily phosphohydrolase (DUF442 family)